MSRLRITPYVFFRTAVAILLHAYTGRARLSFWANFANRRFPGSERLIGWCATTHILLTDVTSNPSFAELCYQVDHGIREAQRNEELPIQGLWLNSPW